MTPLQQYTRRVLVRWRLIALLTIVAASAAGAWSLTSSAPTWTATSALTAQSQDRAPDQDAVLALGYVDYFNQGSYQDLLRSRLSIPADVELTATTGATSPILYVQATGPSEDAVRAAAAAAADRFQQDVRQSLIDERIRAVGDLQGQIDEYARRLDEERNDARRAVIFDQISSLQGEITEIQSNNTNMLKPLQPEPGVASSSSSPVLDVVTGAAGGALLGVLLALLLDVLDRRVRSANDVRLRLASKPVIELDARLSAAERAMRIEQLANRMSLAGLAERSVIAVVGIRAGATAPVFARQLATACSSHQSGALLVLADLRRKDYEGRMGLVEVLDGWTSPRSALVRIGRLQVLPPGSVGPRDPYTVLDPHQIVRFLSDAGRAHPVVVVDAPPLLETSESQILCAAADQVIVVVEPGVPLVEARQALDLLVEVNASVSGVAVVSPQPDDLASAEPTEIEDAAECTVVMEHPVQTNRARTKSISGESVSTASVSPVPAEDAEPIDRAEPVGDAPGRPSLRLGPVAVPDPRPSEEEPAASAIDEQRESEEEFAVERPAAVNEGAALPPSPRPRPRPTVVPKQGE
jgi:polysaccharide biosynthesis transport protein